MNNTIKKLVWVIPVSLKPLTYCTKNYGESTPDLGKAIQFKDKADAVDEQDARNNIHAAHEQLKFPPVMHMV